MRFVFFWVLAALVLTGCQSKKEFGSIQGNAFWKNLTTKQQLPDAGSTVSLWSVEDTLFKQTTTTDIRGDYKFDNLPVGKYYLIANSRNVRDDPQAHIRNISYIKATVEKICNVTFSAKFDSAYAKSNRFADSSVSAIVTAAEKNIHADEFSQYQKFMDSAKKYASVAFEHVPLRARIFVGVIVDDDYAFDFKTVNVASGQSLKLVNDMGASF